MRPKVVFDTNIYISAIIFGGNPRACLELARQREILLYTSKPLLLELARVLHKKFKWEQEGIEEVLKGIAAFATIAALASEVNVITRDPADNRVLEIAQTARPDYIISGDTRHLLPLKKFQSAPIVSAAQFLKVYERK